MLTRIEGGRVIDPVSDQDALSDLWIEDGRIVAPPPDAVADKVIDARGCIVMAGAIDVHSHIAGGNVMLARLLLPELACQRGSRRIPTSPSRRRAGRQPRPAGSTRRWAIRR